MPTFSFKEKRERVQSSDLLKRTWHNTTIMYVIEMMRMFSQDNFGRDEEGRNKKFCITQTKNHLTLRRELI